MARYKLIKPSMICLTLAIFTFEFHYHICFTSLPTKSIIQEKIENISSALSSFENYRDNFICSNKFNKLVILENLLTLFIPISLKNYLYL